MIDAAVSECEVIDTNVDPHLLIAPEVEFAQLFERTRKRRGSLRLLGNVMCSEIEQAIAELVRGFNRKLARVACEIERAVLLAPAFDTFEHAIEHAQLVYAA